MNYEDIIRMAREAGGLQDGLYFDIDVHSLEHFAALVAAAEREKVAAWMIQRGYATGHGDTTEDLLEELDWQVRESEREACAKVCEDMAAHYWAKDDAIESMNCEECATAIRARGNT